MVLSGLDVRDDFSRRVYCILGTPIDDVTMETVVNRIYLAAKLRSRLFVSTPNLNFVMQSQRDGAFRRSLLESDICPADGIGVLLICKLLGVPIASRVAGSDIPAALQATSQEGLSRPLSIVFLGGDPGVGKIACDVINAGPSDRLRCVSAIDPGQMTPERMKDPSVVADINATGADFLIAALGAQRGQAWILDHLQTLTVPVVSHLGATLNFLAGTVRRAPRSVQRLGLEWLWRIKEEPVLVSRYIEDGLQLMGLLLTQILPLSIWLRWNRVDRGASGLSAEVVAESDGSRRIIIRSAVPDNRLKLVGDVFRSATQGGSGIVLDLTELQFFAMGFAGLILMLEKTLQRHGQVLTIAGASPGVARALRWCGLRHLLLKREHPAN